MLASPQLSRLRRKAASRIGDMSGAQRNTIVQTNAGSGSVAGGTKTARTVRCTKSIAGTTGYMILSGTSAESAKRILTRRAQENTTEMPARASKSIQKTLAAGGTKTARTVRSTGSLAIKSTTTSNGRNVITTEQCRPSVGVWHLTTVACHG